MTESTTIRFKKPKREEKRREKIPCLIMLEGNSVGETFHLAQGSVVIGRSDSANISLSEEGVSREHARIDQHESSYTLVDLGSTNGTFLNGEPVEQTGLHDGDLIRMGDVVLRFAFQDLMDVNYQESLRNLAMKDGLTKVFNRKYFLESLDREINYALRKRQPLTCILFDIDDFKGVNDRLGHQAGDVVLKKLALAMSNEVRGYDLFARYEGEKFSILLRGTALENALVFAERFRKQIEQLVVDYEGAPVPVTISVGVAALDPDHALSAEDLVKQADRFVSAAKSKGRNRVMSARSAE